MADSPELTRGFTQLLDVIAPTVASLHGMHDVVKGVSSFFKTLESVVQNFSATFANTQAAFVKVWVALDAVRNSFTKLGPILDNVSSMVRTFLTNVMTGFGNVLSTIVGPISSVFDTLFRAVGLATISIADSIPYFGAIIAVAGSVVSAFLALLPAVLQVASGLVQIGLAALPGGVKVFGDAIEYLTAALGQALAPAVTVLIGGVLTLADMLAGPMLGAANDFITNGLDNAVSAMAWLVDAVKGVITAMPQLFTWFVKLTDWFAHTIGEVGKLLTVDLVAFAFAWIDKVFGALWDVVKKIAGLFGGGEKSKDQVRRDLDFAIADQNAQRGASRVGAGRPTMPDIGGVFSAAGGKGTEAGIRGNMMSSINAMEAELAKKGNIGFTGITDVQKQVQMNAIQNDIQARTLQVQVDILNTLKERLGHDSPPTKK